MLLPFPISLAPFISLNYSYFKSPRAQSQQQYNSQALDSPARNWKVTKDKEYQYFPTKHSTKLHKVQSKDGLDTFPNIQ